MEQHCMSSKTDAGVLCSGVLYSGVLYSGALYSGILYSGVMWCTLSSLCFSNKFYADAIQFLFVNFSFHDVVIQLLITF